MSKYCVSEGTIITLKDKTSKPIEEITIGEELLVFDLKTLEKTQKYNVLVKLSTNNFEGIFKNSVVKNIWTNTKDKFYLINNKLRITGDHILLANRNNKYYWTKVENLQLNDLLFTEMNIFDCIKSIEIINEEIDVYNLEVNTYYNYFADSYLIHNGAPCSACDACGSQGTSRNVWISILTRVIIDSTHTDYTGNWDVSENTFGYSGSARIYIVTKLTANPTYRQDQCIAAVQHVNSNNVIQNGWNFNNTDDVSDWNTSGSYTGDSSVGLGGGGQSAINSPSIASLKNFYSITTTASTLRWSIASGTGSTYTGMADGIGTDVSNTLLSVGDNTISQSSSTNYLYREASSASRYSKVMLRGPTITFSDGDKIRVCQALTTNNTTDDPDVDNSLFMGIY